MSEVAQPALCPSAQPDWEGAVVFGVVGGSALDPRLAYLAELLPVSEELLALTAPALPVEVLRTAAACQTSRCLHHDGQRCSLARRVVAGLPEVTVFLPPCRIRARCQWWQQEGRPACLRCPQVVTLTRHPSEVLLGVGTPPVVATPRTE